MTVMLVSVVIPVFNRPRAVQRAIRAALDQLGIAADDIEVVVVDDASTPPLTLDEADSRVRIIRLDVNGGAGSARNAGVAAARGKYIAFLDSDDLWLPDKLAAQIERLETLDARDPRGLHAVVCGFFSPNRVRGRLESRVPRGAASASEFCGGCWFMPGTALVLKRDTFNAVGPFDPTLRRLEDYEWFVRFGLAGGVLQSLEHKGIVVAPSYSARFSAVAASVRVLKSKYLASTRGGRLGRRAKLRMRAYLALEQGAARLGDGHFVRGLMYLAQSLALQPRATISIGDFWERSETVPADIQAQFDRLVAENEDFSKSS